MKKNKKIDKNKIFILIEIISNYINYSNVSMNVYESSINGRYLLYINDPCQYSNCLALGLSQDSENLIGIMTNKKERNNFSQNLYNSSYDALYDLSKFITIELFDKLIVKLFLDNNVNRYPQLIMILSQNYEKIKKERENENR